MTYIKLKTIKEVKKEVAKKYNFNNWDTLRKWYSERHSTLEIMENEVTESYAKQLLDYVSENAKTKQKEEYYDNEFHYNNYLDKNSILNIKREIR